MQLLNLLGWTWLFLFIIFTVGFLFGVVVENYLKETHPVKKWWRKHIVAPDPHDNWKNFKG